MSEIDDFNERVRGIFLREMSPDMKTALKDYSARQIRNSSRVHADVMALYDKWVADGMMPSEVGFRLLDESVAILEATVMTAESEETMLMAKAILVASLMHRIEAVREFDPVKERRLAGAEGATDSGLATAKTEGTH